MNTHATTPQQPARKLPSALPLIAAIQAGDDGLLRTLLHGGCNPDTTDEGRRPALLIAARLGRVEAARLLLAAGAEVNAASSAWETPLYAAAAAGHEELFFLLLEAGAGLHRQTKAQSTLLHAAANGGDAAILTRVLGSLADKLNARQRNGSTALIIALQRNNTEAVRLLLEAGANPYLRDARRRELMEIARSAEAHALLAGAMQAVKAELPRKLAWHEAAPAASMQVERRRRKEHIPLEEAVCSNNAEAVRLALAAGESPDTVMGYDWSVLHAAAARGNSLIVRLLLEAGADPNVVTEEYEYQTPLHCAAFNGDADTLRELLKAGARPDELCYCEPRHPGDDGEETALEIAITRGHLHAVRALLHAGADFRRRNSEGMTPLHRALLNKQPQMAMEFASLGADMLDAAGADGLTALISCVRFREAGGISLLLQLGANPDAVSAQGNTALHEAIAGGFEQGVELLLSGGAAVDIANKQGETPLHTAARKGDCATARALLLLGADPQARTASGKTAAELTTRPVLRALLEEAG